VDRDRSAPAADMVVGVSARLLGKRDFTNVVAGKVADACGGKSCKGLAGIYLTRRCNGFDPYGANGMQAGGGALPCDMVCPGENGTGVQRDAEVRFHV